MKHYKVIHLKDMVASNPSHLSSGERMIGLNSKCYFTKMNNFSSSSSSDKQISFKNFFFLIWDIISADIIHLNNGRSLVGDYKFEMPDDSATKKNIKTVYNFILSFLIGLDILFLRLIGKKVFVMFQGSDGRIGGYCRKSFKYTHCKVINYGTYSDKADKLKLKKIYRMSRWANYLFSVNPDVLHNLGQNKSFIPYTSINFNEWTKNFTSRTPNSVRVIAHAPTDSNIKGTMYIEAALNELKQEGYKFEYKKIQNIPHSQIKSFFNNIDLLIDQCLTGWYGGVSVEVMSLGIPSMAYIRDKDLKYLSEDFKSELPIINANPNNLKNKIKEFLSLNDEEYLKLSQKSYTFIKKYHSEKEVAKLVNEFYQKEL